MVGADESDGKLVVASDPSLLVHAVASRTKISPVRRRRMVETTTRGPNVFRSLVVVGVRCNVQAQVESPAQIRLGYVGGPVGSCRIVEHDQRPGRQGKGFEMDREIRYAEADLVEFAEKAVLSGPSRARPSAGPRPVTGRRCRCSAR